MALRVWQPKSQHREEGREEEKIEDIYHICLRYIHCGISGSKVKEKGTPISACSDWWI